MSRNSAKKNYEQLIQWLPTLINKRTAEIIAREQPSGKLSKADYYKSKGVK
jgi:hypothetical protein